MDHVYWAKTTHLLCSYHRFSHSALSVGHAQIVHLLLERNKLGTILSDSQGATPLHYAAQSNFAVSGPSR